MTISYPTPAYSNPPINPQYYSPQRSVISGITLGRTTTVTTQAANEFVVGELVKLLIPVFYGSSQLNNVEATIIQILSSTQFVLNLDSSRGVNAFLSSPSYGPNPPQVIPVGGYNSGQINLGRSNNLTYIPGSFINISPA